MYYLEIGETRRSWAETRHNLVSSRSHTIFILEVRQILNNDSEKRGILNLVDLAGSEKVGKSGAQGQLFEEGTKINLSLSALGNVIHALSTNLDYVPYRDSKLTRLLQESLGGNYKTTLIVTCSPHSSQMQETISTLKFAQRAKKLKNKVQMNIKNSPDQLLKVIEQLKQELRIKDEEIHKMASLGRIQKARPCIPRYPDKSCTSVPSVEAATATANEPIIFSVPKEREKPKRSKSAELKRASRLLSSLELSPRNKFDIESFEGKSKGLEHENEQLKTKIKNLTAQAETLERQKAELESKNLTNEITISEERKKAITLEKQLADLQEFINMHNLLKEKSASSEQYENVENKVLRSQIKALTEALEDAETECFKLLKEKKERLEKETIEVCNLSLTDFTSKDVLYTSFTDKWLQDLNSVDLGLIGSFISPKRLFAGKTDLKLDAKRLLSACKYAETIGTAVVDGYVSPETLNYLLRNQVIDAAIMNHNLKRVVSLLVWKLQVERANVNTKNEMCKILQKTVSSLEDLLKKSSIKHQAWKKRVEKLDYEIEVLKQYAEVKKTFNNFPIVKTRIRKPISRLSIMRRGTFKPVQVFSPGRKTSCQTLGGLLEEKCRVSQTTEENGEPQIAEMNEEEEQKLQQVIDSRYKGVCTEQKTPIRQGNGCLLNVDLSKATVGHKGQSIVCSSFRVEQVEQLESNMQELQIELAWHKTLTDLLMTEVMQSRDQEKTLTNEIKEVRASSEQAIQDENRNCQMILSSLKVCLVFE